MGRMVLQKKERLRVRNDCEKEGIENVHSSNSPLTDFGIDSPVYAMCWFREHEHRKSVMASDPKST